MSNDVIMSAITTVGFPIVICLVLLWYIRELVTLHKDETNSFVKAINKNTIVLQKMCDKLNFTMEINDNEDDQFKWYRDDTKI